MNMLSILLMGPGAEGESGGGYETLIMFALLIVVFWLFFIRPQSKKNKELKKMRESLDKGAKVVTIGGIHGKVSEVKEKTIVIELIDKTRMEVEKSAIAGDAEKARESIGRN